MTRYDVNREQTTVKKNGGLMFRSAVLYCTVTYLPGVFDGCIYHEPEHVGSEGPRKYTVDTDLTADSPGNPEHGTPCH